MATIGCREVIIMYARLVRTLEVTIAVLCFVSLAQAAPPSDPKPQKGPQGIDAPRNAAVKGSHSARALGKALKAQWHKERREKKKEAADEQKIQTLRNFAEQYQGGPAAAHAKAMIARLLVKSGAEQEKSQAKLLAARSRFKKGAASQKSPMGKQYQAKLQHLIEQEQDPEVAHHLRQFQQAVQERQAVAGPAKDKKKGSASSSRNVGRLDAGYGAMHDGIPADLEDLDQRQKLIEKFNALKNQPAGKAQAPKLSPALPTIPRLKNSNWNNFAARAIPPARTRPPQL